MPHNPALDAHEHREHAEHAAHEGDRLVSMVSITIAVLAVLASAAGSLETVETARAISASSEAVLAQERATDTWSEYQADSLKRHIYGIVAKTDLHGAAAYAKTAEEQRARQKVLRPKAVAFERDRDHARTESLMHEERHHWLAGAATLIEIGIALSTVAIVTRRRWFWFSAMGLGAVGCVLFAAAYLV